jgi:bifunctional DNase/RNase
MSGPLIEMVVESVRVHMLSSNHVVILKEADQERYLPIWIGPWEANAIAMKLQGLAAERPLTHDLFARTLEELGVVVREVIISDLSDDTFHARLFLVAGDRTIEIDSRPSDALALAVRSGAKIFAEPAVLDRAGVSPEMAERVDTEEELGEGVEGEPGSALERAPGRGADRVVDPRLDVFRDFINSLGTDQDGESRGSG